MKSENINSVFIDLDTPSGINDLDRESYNSASINIYDPNGLTDYSDSEILIKGRGNSTWHDWAKKPLEIKLQGCDRGGKEVPVPFEEADGIYIHLQGKDRPKGRKGREIKVSTTYEGWNKNGELVGKVMSVGFEDGKTFQKLREAMIKQVYDTDGVKLRVLNGDGADWVKNCVDPCTEFQLDRFHVYKKITETIKDKKMQSRIRELHDGCKIEEVLETIQIYADSIATDDQKDKEEKKALELLKYLSDNKEWLISYKECGIKIPDSPEGITYKNIGTKENQNCSNITLRMKHRKCSWIISVGNHMGKILARIANRTMWEDIRHYRDAIVESDKAPIVWEILSAAQAPRYDGAGNKTRSIAEGHIVLRGSGMTASRARISIDIKEISIWIKNFP